MKRKTKLLTCVFGVLACLCINVALVQGSSAEWFVTLEVNNDFYINDIDLNGTSHVYYTGPYENGTTDTYFIERVSSSGVLEKNVTWGDGFLHGVKVNGSRVYCVGVGDPDYGFKLVCFDSSLMQQWNTSLNHSAGFDVQVDGESIYVSGYDWDASSDFAGVLLKFNSSGDLQWKAMVNGSSQDFFYHHVIQGDVIHVVGTLNELAVLARYNATNGQLIQNVTWDNPALTTQACGVDVDGLGNIYVTGSIMNTTDYSFTLLIRKYTPGLDLVWEKTISGASGYCSMVDADHVYITGYSEDGTFLWKYTLDGKLVARGVMEDAIGSSMAVDALGNMYVCGVLDDTAFIVKNPVLEPVGGMDWTVFFIIILVGGVAATIVVAFLLRKRRSSK